MKRLECLDGLRGVLAVYVMLGHMAPFAVLPRWIISALAHGGAAVDVFFILSGEATLVQGGELVDPKLTEPHEFEANSIKGGTRTKLAAGDVVHIPFKVPHQLVLEKGKQITYFVVKINAQ